MLSFRPQNIYKYIKTNDIQSLEKNKNDLQYLIRDEKQITPLSSCIINCHNDVNQLNKKICTH
jgi:thiamine kinase-like enzyme